MPLGLKMTFLLHWEHTRLPKSCAHDSHPCLSLPGKDSFSTRTGWGAKPCAPRKGWHKAVVAPLMLGWLWLSCRSSWQALTAVVVLSCCNTSPQPGQALLLHHHGQGTPGMPLTHHSIPGGNGLGVQEERSPPWPTGVGSKAHWDVPTWGSQFCILPQHCHCHPNMSPLHGACPGCRLHAASHCLHFPGHAHVPTHIHVHTPPKCMYAQTCTHVPTTLAHLSACTPHLCTPTGKHPHIPTSTPKFAHTFVCPRTHTQTRTLLQHVHTHVCASMHVHRHGCTSLHVQLHPRYVPP